MKKTCRVCAPNVYPRPLLTNTRMSLVCCFTMNPLAVDGKTTYE